MATWQQYDGLESRMSKVGGEVAEFMTHLRDRFPAVNDELRDEVMSAAAELTDAMRDVCRKAQLAVRAERGDRRW